MNEISFISQVSVNKTFLLPFVLFLQQYDGNLSKILLLISKLKLSFVSAPIPNMKYTRIYNQKAASDSDCEEKLAINEATDCNDKLRNRC